MLTSAIRHFKCPALFIALVSAGLGCAASAQDASAKRDCAIPLVSAIAPTQDEAAQACTIAEALHPRLTALGLTLRQSISIEVTDTLDIAPGNCVALYSSTTRELQVLPADCLEQQTGRATAFPWMPADVLFQSLIVHELTHAYFDQADGSDGLPIIAHEYLAYALQLDTLTEPIRAETLEKAAVVLPIDFTEINEATLAFYPLSFAALSWLHFQQEGADADLLRRILDKTLIF